MTGTVQKPGATIRTVAAATDHVFPDPRTRLRAAEDPTYFWGGRWTQSRHLRPKPLPAATTLQHRTRHLRRSPITRLDLRATPAGGLLEQLENTIEPR